MLAWHRYLALAEAVRATGANWPQVKPRLIGLSAYRLEINFREATVLGLVGAGGIGMQLQSSTNILAWPLVTTILLLILRAVLASEWVSARVRQTMT